VLQCTAPVARLVKTITILITSILALTMIDNFVSIAPIHQFVVNVVLIGVNQSAFRGTTINHSRAAGAA